MEISYLREVGSTQKFLKEKFSAGEIKPPHLIYTFNQTSGIGSRNNFWLGVNGNLFFSFILKTESLPDDLEIVSSSIYFSYLLKIVLDQKGSKVWLKWPNDFYCNNKKIGGTITQLVGKNLFCGIGLNIISPNEHFGCLDIQIDKKDIINSYCDLIRENISWKSVFSQYKLEFPQNFEKSFNYKNKKISLNNAILNSDGSLCINGEKVVSSR